jgi:hypothetical protein
MHKLTPFRKLKANSATRLGIKTSFTHVSWNDHDIAREAQVDWTWLEPVFLELIQCEIWARLV